MLSHTGPNSLGLVAGARYPLAVVAGVWAWGPVTDPTTHALASWLCALWGRHKGGRGGGAPLAWVLGVRGGALPHARQPVLGACGQGPLPTGCGCGGLGEGTRHQPLSACSCKLALHAVGAARGHLGGGGLWPGCGAPGVGRSPTPDRPFLGRAVGVSFPLAVGAEGVGIRTRHQPHSARSCELALHAVGAARGFPGGGASCLGVGHSGLGALSCRTAGPWGVRPGSATHLLCVRGCGSGDPSPTPQRALLGAGFARCGGGMRALGGGRRLPGCGTSWAGRCPTPDRPSLGRAAGAQYPLAVVAGDGGVGTCHLPHSELLRVGFARRGGGTRSSVGGGPLAWVWGVRGWALSHARPPALGACGRGPSPTGSGCGGCGGPDQSPTPQRALLGLGFAGCGGGTRAPGGGRLLSGCGASGVERSPTPDRPSFGRAARAPYPLAVGAGSCGRGDPSPTPLRTLLRAGFVRCGGGTRAPVGGRLLPGCGASGVGRSPTPDRPSLGRATGACYPLAVAARGVGVGTRHQPRSARSCKLALRAAGVARGPPGGGGVSCLGVGRPGLGALPRPTARPWGVRPVPATHWLWVRGGWVWGPVANPTAGALGGAVSTLVLTRRPM